MPFSMARWTARFPSDGSVFPKTSPKGDAPKPINETFRPVRPKGRYGIAQTSDVAVIESLLLRSFWHLRQIALSCCEEGCELIRPCLRTRPSHQNFPQLSCRWRVHLQRVQNEMFFDLAFLESWLCVLRWSLSRFCHPSA